MLLSLSSFIFLFVLTLAPATFAFPSPPARPNTIPSPLHPRTIDPGTLSIWRVPNTATYITITLTQLMPGPAPALLQLLAEAYAAIVLHVQMLGDGLLDQGALTWYGPAVGEFLDGSHGAGTAGDGLALRMWNANNHQLTYGVVGAAVTGLRNWMLLNQVFGTVRFEIFDGPNMVGRGMIE